MKWLQRLKKGLTRSSAAVKDQLHEVFGKAHLDEEDLEKIETALILADIGVKSALDIVDSMRKRRFEKGINEDALMSALAEEISILLEPVCTPLTLNPEGLTTILVVGVNGSGKTTTIAKLAHRYAAEGKKVALAAGDTFRAAAVEQLKIWGKRTGVDVITAPGGSDAAGLVFDAMTRAEDTRADLLLVDTAGRLHNKHNLMQELGKISRVMTKKNPDAPHQVLLVLDGGTGQNALEQVRVFHQTVNITGLMVTKLDGTSKAGMVVALAREYGLPIHAIGVGEAAEDLQAFNALDFAHALVGKENEDDL